MYLVSGVSHPVVHAIPYPIPVDAMYTTYHVLCSLLSLIRKVYTVRKAIEEQRDAMLLPSLSVDALFLATCYPVLLRCTQPRLAGGCSDRRTSDPGTSGYRLSGITPTFHTPCHDPFWSISRHLLPITCSPSPYDIEEY